MTPSAAGSPADFPPVEDGGTSRAEPSGSFPTSVVALRTPIAPPEFCEPTGEWLAADSSLAALPAWHCPVALTQLGRDLAAWFARYPRLPGVLLTDGEVYAGMVARSRLLELAILPQGADLLAQPLGELQAHLARLGPVLPLEMPIAHAMRRLLALAPDRLMEPAIVRQGDDYRLIDANDLMVADWQLRGIKAQVRYERLQLSAIQTDKLAALGRLVDGVAHQILEPVGFIWGNLAPLADYGDRAVQLLAAYEDWLAHDGLAPPPEVAALAAELDLDFWREDLPKTLASLRRGGQRLKAIVSSLQTFCHLDEVYPKPADLHQHLDGILLLLHSRLRSQVAVERNYGRLPPVPCYIGQLERVFVMLLVRAVDGLLEAAARRQAIAAVGASGGNGLGDPPPPPAVTLITSTQRDDQGRDWAKLILIDNGPEIAEPVRVALEAVFAGRPPTPLEVDWAACYHIVTARHGGRFELSALPTGGTRVEILLPLY